MTHRTVKGIILRGVCLRLSIIEGLLLVWSLIYYSITEDASTGELLRYAGRISLLVAFILIFMIVTLWHFLDLNIIKPLESIAEANRQLVRLAVKPNLIRVGRKVPAEIRGIIASRTWMLRTTLRISKERLKLIEFLQQTFGKYFSEKILKNLLDQDFTVKLGGRREEVTILMSDLRGFSSFAEKHEPEEVVVFLNRYLGQMSEVIVKHNGIIDEFQGDGILAFFRNEGQEDHAVCGVACALKMQNHLKELNRESARNGQPTLEMGIGINTGEVIIGNIGSEQRMKYGLVGNAINVAARIEAQSLGGQVLVGNTTYARIGGFATTDARYEVLAKGLSQPLVIHSVTGIKLSPQLAL